MNKKDAKDKSLSLRLTAEVKSKIEAKAIKAGMTITDFVVAAALENIQIYTIDNLSEFFIDFNHFRMAADKLSSDRIEKAISNFASKLDDLLAVIQPISESDSVQEEISDLEDSDEDDKVFEWYEGDDKSDSQIY